MHWKLIALLSLFGLAMGLATVFFLPSNVEPACWLAIFLVCAYVIAKQCVNRQFLHGLYLGLANCVWITASHIVFFDQYIAGHAREAEMIKSMPMPDSPRLMMALVGPVIGAISGALIGLLAAGAARFVEPAFSNELPSIKARGTSAR